MLVVAGFGVLALVGIGAAFAIGTAASTQTFTYVTPPQTYVSTVTIPTVTQTVTVTTTVAGTTTTGGTTLGPWLWDATTATVASSSLAAGTVGASSGAYAAMSVAEYDGSGQATSSVTIGSTVYQVPIDSAQPGRSTDHHLVVTDSARNLETDLWNYNAATKKASGGGQFPLGSVSEPRPGNADASRLPLVDGVITPSDVSSMRLHPLVFALPTSQVAASPSSVYPGDTSYGGTGGAGTLSLGGWLRLPPNTVCLTSMDKLSLYICRALVSYGMFLRDMGADHLTLYGLDAVNQGGIQAWQTADVTLTQSSVAGLYYLILSPQIPWSTLQALQPPAG